MAAGAVAGLAASLYLTNRHRGFASLAAQVRAGIRGFRDALLHQDDPGANSGAGRPLGDAGAKDLEPEDDAHEADAGTGSDTPRRPRYRRSKRALESRVLAALEDDDVLWRRAVEICALDKGVLELTGRVHSAEEVLRAAAVAREVPGVEVVVNRLAVRGGGHVDTASARVEGEAEDPAPPGRDAAPEPG